MAENEDWRTSLPLEYRSDESLARFKDVGSLVKSYKEMEKYMSSTGRLPKEDSKPEEWEGFYKSWGRPEKPEYKFIDLPKEYQLEDQFKSSISAMAHKLGLNQKQFDMMIQWGMETSKGIFEQQQTTQGKILKELQDEWGFKFNDRAERARKTIAMLVDYKGDDPFIKWLESTGNDKNPVVLRFFDRVSNQLGEDNFVDEQVKQEASDKASAEKKIREIMADSKHPYFNERMPNHKDAVAEMAQLYQRAYGEE